MSFLYRITKSKTLGDMKVDLKSMRDVGIQIESALAIELTIL